jgi:hypothetical protein
MVRFGAIFLHLIIFLTLISFVFGQTDSTETKGEATKSESTKAESTDASKSKEENIEKNKFRLKRGKREIELISAFAPTQPTFFSGRKEYETDHRKLTMFNIRFTRTLGTRKNITYQYFFELTPLAIAFHNQVKNPNYISREKTPGQPKTISQTAFGAGFQPVNFRLIFTPTKPIKPFVQFGVGMIFFNQKMPVPEATAYNFTGDFGGGLYLMTDRERRNKAVTVSYRYFHISNFNTSSFNPGYNANIFSLGYSFSR